MNANIQKINIWELGNRINIEVDKRFIDFLNAEIQEKFNTKRSVHKELIKYYKIPFSTFKVRMKRGYNYFIDLEIIQNLCKILDIDLFVMQKNIIAYKTRRGWNHIENPKLPIEITPIFDMLVAHHIGDGNPINPKRNRKIYFSYRQYNKKLRLLYLEKVRSLVGNVIYKKENYFDNQTRIYLPTAISDLFFNLYSLKYEDYISDKARVPKQIFQKSDEHKLAFLLGIIIDEGHVDSTAIVIGLKNPKLVDDLYHLCQEMKYDSTATNRKSSDDFKFLYILKKGMIKLWIDYLNLKKKFPEIDLGYKEEQIRNHLMIGQREIKYGKGNKELILNLLKNRNLCVNEIAHSILMTRQGVRYHVHNLEKERKIKIVGKKGENNLIYAQIQ